ncbi:MAG: hypothetical protein ACI4QL_02745, partial [Candidatus Fimimonas sp.]
LKGLSLQICADATENSFTLELRSESFAAVLNVSNTDEATFTTIQLDISNFTVSAAPCEKFDFGDFSDRENFVALDSVLKDYLPTIESLVHTNSWQFVFEADSQIDVVEQGATTSYKIAQGSWVKLYFNRAHAEDLMLRANVVLQKLNGEVWNDFVSLDVALIDGRIYLTYNNTLKVTVSLQTLNDCTALLEELQEVIPQLADLMEMLVSVQEEASDISQVDFSEIIKSVSYDDGVFAIVLCGGALIDKAGDVEIAVSHLENTITLNSLQLSYDNVSLHLCNVTVFVSEIVAQSEQENANTKDYEQYVVAQEILDYLAVQGDVTAHISFDSLPQLLRAVIDTAGNDTFAIDGTLNANILSIYNVEISLNLRIDVDENDNGTVYVAALLTRGDKAVFADKGGYSYLFYNGKTGMFDVVRDSYQEYTYCSKCKSYNCSSSFWHIVYHSKETILDSVNYGAPSYHETVDTETFTANILTYILEMVNLSDTVEKIILDNVTASDGSSSQEIALEKLLQAYSYTQGEDNHFDLTLNLAAIDGNLGNMDLSVHHNIENVVVGDVTKEKFNLTRLNGSVTMVSVVNMSIDLYLNQTPVFGDGKYFVENTTLWQNGQHAPEQ